MFKQSLVATAVLVASASPAFALGNAGFEFGTTSQWTLLSGEVGSQLNARRTPTITVKDEADPSFTYTEGPINPLDGTWQGVMTMNKSFTNTSGVKHAGVTYRFTANQQPTTTNDVLSLRLFSADYIYPTFKDYVVVDYVLGGGIKFRDILEDDDYFGASAPDTGWVDFAVPIGTKFINVKLVNAYNRYGNNVPTLLMDYRLYTGPAPAPAPINGANLVTAVPEPSAVLLFVAGLLAVGTVSRRASKHRA